MKKETKRPIKFRLRKKRSRKVVAAIHLGSDYGYTLETTGEGGSFGLNEKNLLWEEFTGTTDGEGIDIYECDVVRYTPPTGKTRRSKQEFVDMEVFWSTDKLQWRLRWGKDPSQQQSLYHVAKDAHHIVVGDIYNKKDLLK